MTKKEKQNDGRETRKYGRLREIKGIIREGTGDNGRVTGN